MNRLPKLRSLGVFKELLEPGGRILYRNLFRDPDVQAAWELLTTLRPWHDQLTCYLNGEELDLKEIHDVLWCAAFPNPDDPCRASSKKKERWFGCPGARVRLGPGVWELNEPTQRHLMTFSQVDEAGMFTIDGEALAAFLACSERAQRCPAAPGGEPERVAASFPAINVRSLGWPLVAELNADLRKKIGAKVLEKEHGFVLIKGQPDLEAHAPLQLDLDSQGEPRIRRVGERGDSIGTELSLPVAARRVLEAGVGLRAIRVEEAYVRRTGGHYELEQRFVISTRVHLLPTDRPDQFDGYSLTTFPRATPEYSAWIERIAEGLK